MSPPNSTLSKTLTSCLYATYDRTLVTRRPDDSILPPLSEEFWQHYAEPVTRVSRGRPSHQGRNGSIRRQETAGATTTTRAGVDRSKHQHNNPRTSGPACAAVHGVAHCGSSRWFGRATVGGAVPTGDVRGDADAGPVGGQHVSDGARSVLGSSRLEPTPPRTARRSVWTER